MLQLQLQTPVGYVNAVACCHGRHRSAAAVGPECTRVHSPLAPHGADVKETQYGRGWRCRVQILGEAARLQPKERRPPRSITSDMYTATIRMATWQLLCTSVHHQGTTGGRGYSRCPHTVGRTSHSQQLPYIQGRAHGLGRAATAVCRICWLLCHERLVVRWSSWLSRPPFPSALLHPIQDLPYWCSRWNGTFAKEYNSTA